MNVMYSLLKEEKNTVRFDYTSEVKHIINNKETEIDKLNKGM